MKRKWRRIVLLFAALVMSSMMLLAQNPEDDPNDLPGDPNDPNNVEDIPLDGGVSLLIAAGIGYGIKRVNDKKNKDKGTKELTKDF